MPFRALRFDVEGSEADAWSDALLAHGALSVEVCDPHAGTSREQARFDEPGEPGWEEGEAHAAWDRSRVIALFDQAADPEAALCAAAAELARPAPGHERFEIAEQDWVRVTQAQFGPITLGGRLHIVPTWCEPPGEGVTITLDPGLAFGTGSHPTTRLCLEWLLRTLRGGESVLDYGCGSGILAIAAAKLGAGRVVGVDVDPQALRASADNASANRVTLDVRNPDAIGEACFDVIVANILTNPLIVLAPALAARVRAGGALALAGLLDAQADAVASAYAPWFTLRAVQRAEGWTLLTGTRL